MTISSIFKKSASRVLNFVKYGNIYSKVLFEIEKEQ